MDRERAVELHQSQLRIHDHDPRTGRCPRCARPYCPPYAEATALLADADERVDLAAVEVRS